MKFHWVERSILLIASLILYGLTISVVGMDFDSIPIPWYLDFVSGCLALGAFGFGTALFVCAIRGDFW